MTAPRDARTTSAAPIDEDDVAGRRADPVEDIRDDPAQDELSQDDLAQDDLAHDDLAHDDLAHDDLAQDDLAQDDQAQDDASTDAVVAPRRAKKTPSAISGRKFRKRDLVKIDTLRPSLAERIRRDYPDLPANAKISFSELARYRMLYVEELLQQEHGEFTELDRQVAESISRQDTIAENTEEEYEEHRTLGERLSDHLASFGGSWSFLISFGVLLFGWMGLNLWAASGAFDPYPFILLNLVLSCLAAIQAPIIMMSQKRQEEKDRQRSLNDYKVNLKAELEIRHLHEKIDYLISRQWQRLSELQQVQIEMLHQSERRVKVKNLKTTTRRAETEGDSDGAEA